MANSPFGFLLPPAGPLAPPELEVQSISSNQLAYTIPASAIKSHIAVFLLPGQTLPPGAAAALYIQFPGQQFKFLGALGEGKASAIFRVAGLKDNGNDASTNGSAEVDMEADEGPGAAAAQGNVTIGISLEAVSEVAAKLEAQQAQQAAASETSTTALVKGWGASVAQQQQQGGAQPSTDVLAQRIIQNAFNFLASFEGTNGMVPIKAFEGWWQKFERRVANDPGFLEREQD